MKYSHLNTAQTRVHNMKAELQNIDTDHLQSFIDGITDPEPPDYRKVNGKVEPSLQKVKLKAAANRYHIGNVIYTDGSNKIEDFTLVVEKGEVEAYGEVPIPKDANNPLSYPILDTIVMELIPMWGEKYKAIKQRMRQINDLRAFAHNAPNLPGQRLSYGTTLTKLIESSPSSPNSPHSRKRSSGEPVPKHPANKRPRLGLESIPDSVKTAFFSKLPDKFKIEMFNSIAQSAFPGFENVMTAAWNVVSLYEHVGSEFGAMHRVIVELKNVLIEVDAAWGESRGANGGEKEEVVVKEEPLDTLQETSPLNSAESDGARPTIRDSEAQEEHDGSQSLQEHPQTPVQAEQTKRIQSNPVPQTPVTKDATDETSLFVSGPSAASARAGGLADPEIVGEVTIEGRIEEPAPRSLGAPISRSHRESRQQSPSDYEYQEEKESIRRDFTMRAKGADPEEEGRLRKEYMARVKGLRQQLKDLKNTGRMQPQDDLREKKPSPSNLVRSSYHRGNRDSRNRDNERNVRPKPSPDLVLPQNFSDEDEFETQESERGRERGGREMHRMSGHTHHSPKLGHSMLARRK